ncbi:hypothetical protein Hanom_Chr09g00795661 [Helianthus anomalus]
MGAKDKFKDDGPPADTYVENALFKRLSQSPSECTVIPEGALVMAGATAVSAPTSVVSPPRAKRKRRILPPLTSFQATKAAHALPAGSFAEA